eukprot:772379-Amorphochlora_amoeboformis.AAC.1
MPGQLAVLREYVRVGGSGIRLSIKLFPHEPDATLADDAVLEGCSHVETATANATRLSGRIVLVDF